jgi:hypothetical protein
LWRIRWVWLHAHRAHGHGPHRVPMGRHMWPCIPIYSPVALYSHVAGPSKVERPPVKALNQTSIRYNRVRPFFFFTIFLYLVLAHVHPKILAPQRVPKILFPRIIIVLLYLVLARLARAPQNPVCARLHMRLPPRIASPAIKQFCKPYWRMPVYKRF